jgi:gamma-glutamylcyclotransferase (GGCT)/AIG2-like uncharacterized protein YtfP
MANQPSYLFVYGTLRSKVDIPVKQEIVKHWQLVGESEIKGKLYDMGDYPAAVPAGSGEHSTIKGEVYMINEPVPVFAVLDKYEGEAYTRKQETVTLPDGRSVQAWVYWYTRPVEGKILISEKDYLTYREKKGKVY